MRRMKVRKAAMENGKPVDDTHDFVFSFRNKG